MSKSLRRLIVALLTISGGNAFAADDAPRVRLQTTMGTIEIELYADKAPKTVDNFIGHVRAGDYDGTIFHRVIKGFMIQGGGFAPGMKQRPAGERIRNEADSGLQNKRGTIAMARTGDPHSASNQFFINTVDNAFLDHRGPSQQGWGYAVFGRVVKGMDVVDRIEAVETGRTGGFTDVPRKDVVIKRAELVGKPGKD